MHFKLSGKAFAAPSALVFGLSLGARSSAAAPREPNPAPIFHLLTLEEILEANEPPAKREFVSEGGTTARFGAALLAPLLTFSRLFPPLLIAQNGAEDAGAIVGQPWTGAVGIGKSVGEIMEEQAALDRQGVAPAPEEAEDEHEYPLFDPKPTPDTIFSATWPIGRPALPRNGVRHGGVRAQSIGAINFRATGYSAAGYYPPDTEGDVGPTQILVIVNGRIIVYNRDGTNPNVLNATTNTFFSSVRNGSSCSDPKARFDRITQRWFLSIINVTSVSNRVMLAVSDGPVITSASSFKFYQFAFDQPTPVNAADTGGFADYPSLGVDANAIYIGINVFKGNYAGSTAFVIQKSSVTATPVQPIVVTAFRQVANSGGSGLYTPQGASNDDPNAVNGYFVAPNTGVSGLLNFRRVLNPGGVPTLTSLYSIAVPATANPLSAPAQGSTSNLDASDLRIFSAQAHRNALTGSTTLWTAHTVSVNASGISSSPTSRDGTRWYEIQNLDSTPTLKQAGTLYDPAASAPLYFTYGTVAASGQGAMALGATATGTTSPTKIAVSGRLVTDPAGATQPQTIVSPATGTYNGFTGGRSTDRWGDYSHTVVDPQDDQTFWTFQMYADTANAWAIQVLQLLAPPPPTLSGASPATLPQSATSFLTVTGVSSAGSAFYNPLPEYARHLTASTNAPGVVFGKIALVVPANPTTTPVTQITLTATVPASVPQGTYDLTITNPDGQSVTAANALTVTAPGATLSSLNPASAEAGSGDFTLTVNGAGFTEASVVNFNGAPRPTTLVSSGQLTAAIPGADIATVGSYDVTVATPTGSGMVATLPLPFAVNTVSMAGSILLEGLTSVAPLFDQAIRLDFRAPGTTIVLFTRATTVGLSSAFKFGGVTPGKYDVAFKGAKYLRGVVTVDASHTSQTGVNVMLPAGDANDDNSVDATDFGIFVGAYNSTYAIPGSGYDPAADFNDDGTVDTTDFGLLVGNYGSVGAP